MKLANPTKLSGHYDWIFPLDDAFDNGLGDEKDEEQAKAFRDAYAKWQDTGDADLLQPFVRDGHRPAVFQLAHMSVRQRHYVVDLAARDGNAQAAYEACRLALKSIRVDGAEAPTWEPEFNAKGWEVVPDNVMEVLHAAHPSLIVSMGTHASNKAHPSKN